MPHGSTVLVQTSRRLRARAAAGCALGVVGAVVLAGCGSDASTAADPSGATSPADGATTDAASASATPTPSDDPSTPAASATAFDLPACDAVWIKGATLPDAYEGCLDASGVPVADASTYCEFGTPIFTHDRRFYAVAGGPVTETDGPLNRDPQYRRAKRSCAG